MSTNPGVKYVKEGQQHRRIDIQIMRGIAVLAVLLFHTKESWFTAGYLGVDVFFVISGFVVTPLISRIFFQRNGLRTKDSISGLREFYARRFFRLAPALGVTLILSLVLIFLFGPVFDHVRFTSQGLAALFLLGNLGAYSFSGGNYFAPNPNPLIHLWSLSAEEQIYFFLPLVIFLFLYFTSKRKVISLKPVILFLGISAYLADVALRMFPHLLQQFGISDVQGFMFYSPVSRLWEFCFGSTAYFFAINATIIFGKIVKYFNYVIAILIGGLLFLPINGYKFQSLTISFLAAIALFFGSFECLPRILHRGFSWLGDRSYSVYLIHMPLLYVAAYSPVLERIRSIAIMIAFSVSIAAGATIYQHIEERFRVKHVKPIFRVSTFRTLFVYFILIPLFLLSGMRYSAVQNYWGLNPNPILPVYASDADPNCLIAVTPCEYLIQNGKGPALLIGDSHAGPLFQTFTEAMMAEGVSSYVWQKNGCYFVSKNLVSRRDADLLGYDVPRPDEPQTCFSHNESIIKWLESHPKSVVFISQRSSSNRPISMSETAFRNLLLRNLVYLKSLSAHLIVIGPNPEFPDAKQFFGDSQLIWQKAYTPLKSFPVTSMIVEPMRDSGFFSVKLAAKDIHYLDLISPFCTSKTCTRWYQSRWLFVDDDHLSPYGAEKIKPLIQGIASLNF